MQKNICSLTKTTLIDAEKNKIKNRRVMREVVSFVIWLMKKGQKKN